MSDRLLKRRLVLAPLFIALCVYDIVTIGNEEGVLVLVAPTLALGFGASPLAAWLLARSERRHTFERPRGTGRRELIGALGIVLGVIPLSRVLGGILVLLCLFLLLTAGWFLAAVWELARGTYRREQMRTPTE
jgi:hypothetical protein